MACGTCGQKYRGLRSSASRPVSHVPRSNVLRPRKFIRGRGVVENKSPTVPNEPTSTVQQEDVKQGVVIGVPNYEIDPSTGIAVDVLKTGQCEANNLGDVLAQPVNLGAEGRPGEKKEG